MADFVDQDVPDEMLETFSGFTPVIEDRATVEENHIDIVRGRRDTFLIDGYAPVEAEQIERGAQGHFRFGFLVGKFFDSNDDAIDVVAQFARNRPQGVSGDGFHILQAGRLHGGSLLAREPVGHHLKQEGGRI